MLVLKFTISITLTSKCQFTFQISIFEKMLLIVFIQRADLTSIEIIQENETNKKLVSELQSHVIDLEYQLVEAEKLRKKLHNTILVCFLIIFYAFSTSNIYFI